MTKRLALSIIAAVVGLVIVTSTPVSAKKLCKARIDCPANYRRGDTVYVPDSVVMLTKWFRHCARDSVREAPPITRKDTISIFFVIDHSASMAIMDSTSIRYRIAAKIIDSLAQRSPASEVGIAVFSNQLMHRYTDDPYFVPLDTSRGWPDSYVPLTKLNTMVGGVNAVQKLKWSIELAANPNDTDIGGNRRLVNANYSSTGRRCGWDTLGNPDIGYAGTTDISLGFEAAKQAFTKSTRPRHRQYIIFLSDGVHQYVDIDRRPQETAYVQGSDIPTTFTAFFINEAQTIPDQILEMTENIQNNGYSSSNPKSEVWKARGAEEDLVSRLLEEYIFETERIFRATPRSMTINGVSAARFEDDLVFFDTSFVLTGMVTRFDVGFSYLFTELNGYEETREGHFFVMRTNFPPAGKPFFPGVECWDQGTLQLRYNNEPVNLVQANWTDLQVRFTPPTEFPISAVSLEISNKPGSDKLTKTTTNHGTYFGTTFKREYGTPAIDDILQNVMNDSIIITYRNPHIPLDVVRLAVKVLPPRDLEVSRAYYLDQSGGIANGFPDVLRVEFGDTLYPEELEIVKTYINIQSPRNLTIRTVLPSDKGFDIILNEPATGTPFTGLFPNERLFIENVSDLPRGGWFPKADVAIRDSMAPVIVSAEYLDLADSGLRDTLRVLFSEPVKPITTAEPFRFISGSTQYTLRLSRVSPNVDTNYAVFTVEQGQTVPKPGDSIWISTTGNVSDVPGVRQTANNIRRELKYLMLYKVLSATYIDTNGDGLIDIVQVMLDRPPDQAMLGALYETTKLPDYRNFQYGPGDFEATADGFRIKVTQNAGTTPFTGVDARDSLRIGRTESTTNGLIEKSTVAITDIMAPVINSASLKPGTVTSSDEPRKDTLRVTFSEAIVPPSSKTPFTFTDGTTTYTAYVTPIPAGFQTTHTFIVDSIVGRDYFAPGDSIRINPAAQVSDQAGNVQDKENRYAPMSVSQYVINFEVKAGPMPFNPTQSNPISPSVGLQRPVDGLAVVVQPIGRVPSHIKLIGTLNVFDALGNLVGRDLKSESISRSNEKVVFVWNGANLSNRYVGSGSYRGVAVIQDENNAIPKQVKQFKIAVKR